MLVKLCSTTIAFVLAAGLMSSLAGCYREVGSNSSSDESGVLHYLGEGEFRVRQGAMAVTAQLELLPGDRYRFLILEPGVLAMIGPEEGQVERTAQGIVLQPVPATLDPEASHSKDGNSALQSLRKVRKGSPGRVKTLTTQDNGASYQLSDGGMRLRFTRQGR